MNKKGVSRFSVEVFSSQIAEKYRGRPFCVSEMFWFQKFFDNKGITFLVEIFCVTLPKIIVGEPVCVSELFWFQNLLDNRGITILSIVFVSQCQKICGEPFNDSKKLGHPKVLCIIVESHDFPCKSSSLTVPKNFVGNLSVFQRISGTGKFYA